MDLKIVGIEIGDKSYRVPDAIMMDGHGYSGAVMVNDE